MRKRLLAAVLTLAMCFGLGATALASETNEAPDAEGYEAVSVDFSGGSVIYLAENIMLSSAGDWSAKPAAYTKITPGTQITVSNTGTDASSYIFIQLDPYYYKSEQQTVEGQRTYNNLAAEIYLSSKDGGDNLFGPASNDLYWNFKQSETDRVELHPNDSVTFTLPETAPDEDIIYVLWCCICYPERDNQSYSGAYFVSYHSLPSIPAVKAVPNASSVLVNGEKTAFDAYTIIGNNYFKLRDLAYVLNGTEKQFEVGWDGAANAISLTSGKPYTAVGGEMTTGSGTGQITTRPTSSKIFVDGKEVSLTAYTINGNNYFKLRDIGQTFDFGVDWDGAAQTIRIDTSKGYTPD